jgi:hypothetical protein
MNYLQKQRDGDYKFFSGDLGPVLEVEVSYSLGGVNMWDTNRQPRGIYISLTPCERSEHSTMYTIDFGANMGKKTLVRELKKKSQKILDLIAVDLDQKVGEIVGYWNAGERGKAWEIVFAIKSKWLVQGAPAAA